MIEIKEKANCCGCTACFNICPKKCISMCEDEEGFKYPRVDKNLCINCNMCEKVCPILHKPVLNNSNIGAFVARDKREQVLINGTSGGLFTSIMEYVLKNNGVAYGVIVDDDKVVKHVRIDSLDSKNFNRIPNSKYVQSDLTNIFTLVINDLKDNKLVVFSGTPCQVAGLYNFIGKGNKNLVTIDIVCHGTPSPLAWKKYVEFQEHKHKSKIVDARFRNKTYGYHSGGMRLVFANGKRFYCSARTDLFLKSFFLDLCSRPSCYGCKFKDKVHASDLTLFDSWHVEKLIQNVPDDNKGFTNILVNSEKGKEIIEKIAGSVLLYPSNFEKSIELDGVMVSNSVKWNDKRTHYFENIKNESFDKHCNKFFHNSFKDKMIERLKKIYYIGKGYR